MLRQPNRNLLGVEFLLMIWVSERLFSTLSLSLYIYICTNYRIISLLVANPKDSGIPYVPFPAEASGTLIVSPLSLLSNWTSQIEEHLVPSTLSVLVFHGTNKKDTKLDLGKYDIVITSYGVLVADYKAEGLDKSDKKPRKSNRSIFGRIWKRVVLDEGHTIRNARTKMSRAAVRLDAVARWSLTGTTPSIMF